MYWGEDLRREGATRGESRSEGKENITLNVILSTGLRREVHIIPIYFSLFYGVICLGVGPLSSFFVSGAFCITRSRIIVVV